MRTMSKKVFMALVMVLTATLMVGTSVEAKKKNKNKLVVIIDDMFQTKSGNSDGNWRNCLNHKKRLHVYYNGKDITYKTKMKSSNKKVATVKVRSRAWCKKNLECAESSHGFGEIVEKHYDKSWTLTVTYKGMKKKIKIKGHKHKWEESDMVCGYLDSELSREERTIKHLYCYACGCSKILSNKEYYALVYPDSQDYYDAKEDLYYARYCSDYRKYR